MRSNKIKFLSIALCCLVSVLKSANSTEEYAFSEAEHTLLRLVNMERTSNLEAALPLLQEDVKLMQVARNHSLYMASNCIYSHEGYEGKRSGERVKDSGYCLHNYSSENIHRSDKLDLETIAQSWMSSPGHRKNILNENFKDTGVGIAQGQDGKIYFTQVFSTQARVYK